MNRGSSTLSVKKKRASQTRASSQQTLLNFATTRAAFDPLGTLDTIADAHFSEEDPAVAAALATLRNTLRNQLLESDSSADDNIAPLISPVRSASPLERHIEGHDTTVEPESLKESEAETEKEPPCFPTGLNPIASIFVLFDDPNASKAGKFISIFVMVLIMFSTTSFLLESMQEFRETPQACQVFVDNGTLSFAFATGQADAELCEPQPFAVFNILEVICISLFTVEYMSRTLCVWAASDTQAGLALIDEVSGEAIHRSGLGRTFCYCTQGMNLIDFMAIFPFYVELAMGGGAGATAVLRVLRLARVFRIFKMGKFNQGLSLFVDAMILSTPAVGLLAFFGTVIVILFGSLMYFCESAMFDVSSDFTNYGALDTADLAGANSTTYGATVAVYGATINSAMNVPVCDVNNPVPYDSATGLGCIVGAFVRPVAENDFAIDYGLEISPFVSIPVSLWWCLTTITTVGYGDLFPTTVGGRVVGILCFYAGIIFLAMPITILGLSFEEVYTDAYGSDDEEGDDMSDADLLEDVAMSMHPEEVRKKHTRYSLGTHKSQRSSNMTHDLTSSQVLTMSMANVFSSSSASILEVSEEDIEQVRALVLRL
jgi:hypothetical protein